MYLLLDSSPVVIADPNSILECARRPWCVDVLMQRDYAPFHMAASNTPADLCSIRRAGVAVSALGELAGKRN